MAATNFKMMAKGKQFGMMADNTGHGLVRRRIGAIAPRHDFSVETGIVWKSNEMGVNVKSGKFLLEFKIKESKYIHCNP